MAHSAACVSRGCAWPDVAQLCSATLQTHAAPSGVWHARWQGRSTLAPPGQVGAAAVECLTLNTVHLSPGVCVLITPILSCSLKAPTIKETRIHVSLDYIRISSEPAIFLIFFFRTICYSNFFYFFYLSFSSSCDMKNVLKAKTKLISEL